MFSHNSLALKNYAATVPAPQFARELYKYWNARCTEMLQERNNLDRDDLEYLAETAVKLKDERLKTCIATLIGWGDDERAELETFCAIALELMKTATPSRLRNAALNVELRSRLRDIENEAPPAVTFADHG
jgi:hypothetical protein